MPAYFSHYTCGVKAYESIPISYLKKCISDHRHAYCFGLEGPDFVFFNVTFGKRNLGSIMHEEKCGLFLRNLYKECVKLKGESRRIALAYYAGFLGHYALDTVAHPLVYSLCEEDTKMKSLGKHFRYEAAMDNYVVRDYLKREVTDVKIMQLTRLWGMEKKVVMRVFNRAVSRTYHARKINLLSVYMMYFSYAFVRNHFNDKFKIKENFFEAFENVIYKHSFHSALYVNNNLYGYTKEDYKLFNEKMEMGIKRAAEILRCFNYATRGELYGEEEKWNREYEFFKEIGSFSYHSGERLDDAFYEDDEVENYG
ncbi:zinc dependent phospholipase C family protein [Lachnospira pectinoschiza]|uniref:Zinc dependent phospholipase C n=1 Tax=Lachnospira pectinoschiza TaxID=28052 RepID=A0A1G9WR17_9FIRM|nr:zinc dependent phospholipase C family protein [Lachnospira pectinoschiza]SDM86809.1 Zinc dependent phospholipase C [Lachnospira pectinoschiza]